MTRYIDADKLIRIIELANWGDDFLETASYQNIKRYIDDEPIRYAEYRLKESA